MQGNFTFKLWSCNLCSLVQWSHYFALCNDGYYDKNNVRTLYLRHWNNFYFNCLNEWFVCSFYVTARWKLKKFMIYKLKARRNILMDTELVCLLRTLIFSVTFTDELGWSVFVIFYSRFIHISYFQFNHQLFLLHRALQCLSIFIKPMSLNQRRPVEVWEKWRYIMKL